MTLEELEKLYRAPRLDGSTDGLDWLYCGFDRGKDKDDMSLAVYKTEGDTTRMVMDIKGIDAYLLYKIISGQSHFCILQQIEKEEKSDLDDNIIEAMKTVKKYCECRLTCVGCPLYDRLNSTIACEESPNHWEIMKGGEEK